MAITRASTASLLHRVQSGLSNPPVELIYTPHDCWPIPRTPLQPPTQHPIRILVLDASFNPPTLAHLALANASRPSYSNVDPVSIPVDYDAKLLLLSVRNADKILKPGDASHLQRLEMIKLFAKDVTPTSSSAIPSNVAIAITNEPTFVGKSSSLQAFFKSRFAKLASATSQQTIFYDTPLTFLLGLDTLERLVQPHYYPSQSQMLASLQKFLSPPPNGDNSLIICARRIPTEGRSVDIPQIIDFAPVQEFISSQRIVFIDINEKFRGYSSSEVRNTIAQLGLNAPSWKKLVPDEIAEYIVREKLYTCP